MSLHSLTSEQELPTPSAIEEKVPQHLHDCVWIMTSDVWYSVPFWTTMHDFCWCRPTAKASGGWASREMAEDGEEMGQVQEQWEGEYITLMRDQCLSLHDIPGGLRWSSMCTLGLHTHRRRKYFSISSKRAKNSIAIQINHFPSHFQPSHITFLLLTSVDS